MIVPRLPEKLVTIGHIGGQRIQIVGIAHRPERHFRKGFAHVDYSNPRTVMTPNIKDYPFTDLVDCITGTLDFSPRVKAIFFNNAPPSLQGRFRLRVTFSEHPQGAVTDDSRLLRLSHNEIIVDYGVQSNGV